VGGGSAAVATPALLPPAPLYRIAKRAWIINDIEREKRKSPLAQENAA